MEVGCRNRNAVEGSDLRVRVRVDTRQSGERGCVGERERERERE